MATRQRWSRAKRFAFRFWFLYAGLYVLATQVFFSILLLPGVELPDPGTLGPARAAVEWVARHVFGVTAELVVTGSGSGDKIFDWTQVFCFLALAALGAGLWSLLDRRRAGYAALDRWLRVAIRIALGSSLISYGLNKLVPLQMPYPSLSRLVEPFGNFSPMGVLWTSVGASPAYEIFTGIAETVGGVLVLVPRTAFLGTLICLADVIEVFVLNMTYDVPVKLFSLHLVVFCLYLLAPEWPRLRDFFLRDSGVGPSTEPPLFRTRRANRVAAVVMILYAAYALAMNVHSSIGDWTTYGGGGERSALYGIWNVELMVVDGVARPALASDAGRWRRLIFQRPTIVTAQRMDDSFVIYQAELGAGNRRLGLKQSDDETWTAGFLVDRPVRDRLVLEGDVDHHRARVELRLVDHAKLLLPSRGFHWIQERPFNR